MIVRSPLGYVPLWPAVALALLTAGCPAEAPAPAEPPPAPPPVPEEEPEPAAAAVIRIEEASGTVEARRDDVWVPTAVGEVLGIDEHVRTADGSEARLSVGPDTYVLVREGTEVSVRDVSAEVARVRLERGRIGADLDGSVVLQVEAAGHDAVAEATSGRFSVFSNGRGLVAVAAETAEVRLQTAGGDTMLAAGEQATVRGESMAAPSPIPESVLLNVVWPDARVTRQDTVTLRGRVDPGSEVAVNGEDAEVAEDGRFQVRVALAEGPNRLEVRATDPLGRVEARDTTVRVVRRGPDLEVEGDLWR